jgi:hypothetical protein
MVGRFSTTGTVFPPVVAEPSATRYHHSPGGSGPRRDQDPNVIET